MADRCSPNDIDTDSLTPSNGGKEPHDRGHDNNTGDGADRQAGFGIDNMAFNKDTKKKKRTKKVMPQTYNENIKEATATVTLPPILKTGASRDMALPEKLVKAPLPSIASQGQKGPMEDDTENEKEDRWLARMKEEFIRIAGVDKVIDREEFKTALQVKKSFFADRFFDLFDKDGSGSIDLEELLGGLERATKCSEEEKLKFLFDVFDVDGSGFIDQGELKQVLKSCMEESSLKLSEQNLDDLTSALFSEADSDGSGHISFGELLVELKKHPGVLENLSLGAAQWLRPAQKEQKKPSKLAYYFSQKYFKNNASHLVFLLVYFLINVVCFMVNAVRYQNNNGWVIVARGCGMCLNFNGAFVLVLMLRHCLTWLRTTLIGRRFLPLDRSVEYHKMVGIVIAFHTVVHTFCHLVNIHFLTQGADGLQYWEYLFTLRSKVGFVGPGFAFLSGVILDLILVVMVICSMPFIRRGGYFQVFYWTHLLYWVFWIFFLMHGPIFYFFFAIPGLLFIIEKVYDLEPVKKLRYGNCYITEVNLLSSKVTHLVISIPEKFTYQPGDYVFIRIPPVAKHEYHPFTISSAPEMTGTLWLHIRGVGHWTNSLYEYFEKYDATNDPGIDENGSGGYKRKASIKAAPNSTGGLRTKFVKVQVYLDGPYGTPTRDIFQTDHAVLIGSGIGVTPYASILQSMMYKYKQSVQNCPHCNKTYQGEIPANVMKVKKVDFIWINRDQKSFEWFVSLLTNLESQEAEEDGSFDRFFDMQMYMTAALKKSDMKGLGLQMAMDIIHRKEKRDVITGLRTRTQPGRPDWGKIFAKINDEQKGSVAVFFCGAPAVAQIITKFCDKYQFKFSKESF